VALSAFDDGAGGRLPYQGASSAADITAAIMKLAVR